MRQAIELDQVFSLSIEEKDFLQKYLIKQGYDQDELQLTIGQMVEFIRFFIPIDFDIEIKNIVRRESSAASQEFWMVSILPTDLEDSNTLQYASTELVDSLWLTVKYYIIRNLKNYKEIEI